MKYSCQWHLAVTPFIAGMLLGVFTLPRKTSKLSGPDQIAKTAPVFSTKLISKPDVLAPVVPDPAVSREFESYEAIPDCLDRMRRGRMPRSARRRLLLADMMRLISEGGYQEREFTAAWEKVDFEQRSMLSSVRLEALARLKPSEFTSLMNQRGMNLAADASSALAGMASADAPGALKLLNGLQAGGWKIDGRPLFQEWARQDGSKAWAAAQTLERGTFRNSAVSAAFQGWMMSDAKAAITGWAKSGEAEAGRKIMPLYRTPASVGNDWAAEVFFQVMRGKDASGTSNQLWQATEGADNRMLVREGFVALAGADPAATIRIWHASQEEFLKKRISAGRSMEGLLEGLAWNSPQQAIDFLKDASVQALFSGKGGAVGASYEEAGDMMAGSPEAGVKFAEEMIEKGRMYESVERSLIQTMLYHASINGDAQALPLLANIGRDHPSAFVSQQSFQAGTHIDPSSYLQLITDPESRNTVASRYAGNMVTTDFKLAVEWASTHEAKYPGSVKALFDAWGTYDQAGRSEMLRALAPEERQDLVPNLAENLASTHPAIAVAWAASMLESPERTSVLSQVVKNARESGSSLDGLLAAPSLSETDRNLIRQTWSSTNSPR